MVTPTPAKTVTLTPELLAYVRANSSAADPLLDELSATTRSLVPDQAHMLIAPEQGSFLTFLARLVGARSAIEVGTFTGYSSICLARGLGSGGRLLTCDVSEEWTEVAGEFWRRAGLTDRIDLRLGPALQTLRSLPAEPFLDLAFIDADKPGYIAYWEEIVVRMRPGGVIVVDNTLFSGEVLDPDAGPKPAAIRAFNAHAAGDPRVESVMLPLADGVTLARRLS